MRCPPLAERAVVKPADGVEPVLVEHGASLVYAPSRSERLGRWSVQKQGTAALLVVPVYERLPVGLYRTVWACSGLSAGALEAARGCVAIYECEADDGERSEELAGALCDGMCSGEADTCECFFDDSGTAIVCSACGAAPILFSKTVGRWCDDVS